MASSSPSTWTAGDYAIAGSVLAAAERLRARRPDADAWLVRVGHPTLRTFGGSSLWRAK